MGILKGKIIGLGAAEGNYVLPSGGGLNEAMPSNTVMAYDFTDALSHTTNNSTALKNIITSPADSEAQATYDGTTTNALSVQNEIGKSNAYFHISALGTYIEMNTATVFKNSMHKAGASHGVSIAFRTYANADLTNMIFSNTNGNDANRIHYSIYRLSATSIKVSASNGTVYSMESTFTIPAMTTYTDYLFVVSYDDATGVCTLWVNGIKYSNTGDSLVSPTATNGSGGGRWIYGSGSDGLENGMRFYGGSLHNTLLSDAQEGVIRKAWEASHNRSYTDEA